MNTTHGYRTLTTDDLRQVRAERVRALELDHARTVLLCRETIGTPDEQGSRSQLAEIERRIAVHLPPAPDGEPEPEEAPRHAAEPGNETITVDTATTG